MTLKSAIVAIGLAVGMFAVVSPIEARPHHGGYHRPHHRPYHRPIHHRPYHRPVHHGNHR